MLNRRILQSLGLAYRRRIVQSTLAYTKAKTRQLPGPWIGRQAEEAWIAKDLPAHAGVKATSIVADPMSAVSNMGDPRRTDALVTIGGERVQFELKKSDYRSRRTREQLAAQVFDLGLGTYGASGLYRICADEGTIGVWSREQAKAAIDAVEKRGYFDVPKPVETIHFAPDVSAKFPEKDS